jgi:hypothetical protein
MTIASNAIVSGGIPLFAVLSGADRDKMLGPNACAAATFGRTVDFKFRPVFPEKDLI